MDVAQFLDFMLGSALATPQKNVSADTTRQKLLDKASTDLRSVIEDTLPIIYLVKTDDIVKNLLTALGKMDEAQLSKYIVQVNDPIEGPTGPIEPGFDEVFSEAYEDAVSDYKSVSKLILNALGTRITKTITLQDLSSKVSNIQGLIDKASSAYAITLSTNSLQDTSNITEALRAEIIKAGNELRSYLNSVTPAKFTDAEQVLNDYNKDSELLIVGATFSGLTGTVNKIASPIIREWLKSHRILATNDLTVGQFTAAGHVAVVEKQDEIKQIVGINTPLTQATLLYATQKAKTNVTMDTFVLDSTHIDCALSIKKDTGNNFKNLLSLNFSFVMSQEAEFNSVTLRMAEVTAMDKIVKNTFQTTREMLKQTFLKTIVSKKGLAYLVSSLRFSPTLEESISLQILSALKGESSKKILASGNTKHKSSPTKTSLISKNNLTNAIKKISNTSKVSKSIPKKSSFKSNIYSLVGLQNLINQHLQTVISANMGDGSSRNVLNYRTGRFAASAAVTRMSQSRAGMITAFYTYMKNPYQTFEPGYRQGSPKSRDPKLLISKSIREIAADKVGNRLRAVLV